MPHPQAKDRGDCREPPEEEGEEARKDPSSLRAHTKTEAGPADCLILDFWPPELGEYKCLLFEVCQVWGNQSWQLSETNTAAQGGVNERTKEQGEGRLVHTSMPGTTNDMQIEWWHVL